MIQLPHLLYLVAEQADGQRTYPEIAESVTQSFERGLSPQNVEFLVEEKLRPLGIIAGADGQSPELKKIDPLLALKFRAALVPEGFVNALTRVFKPLFFPVVVVAAIAGLVAVDVWLFFFHGVAQGVRGALYDPVSLLLLLGLVILAAAFHETGHATACAYGGARPGVMGAGVYLVWPAFYTDVTDAYRLGKGGRLRTDLGGIYFNSIFILVVAGAYFATGWEPLLLFIPLMHVEMIHQLLPVIRLDGYYIVSDLTGVPDMFARIKPTLASLIPGKKASEEVTELKPWVRVAVTIYVVTVIPLLLFVFGMMVLNAPRIFATAWDSFWLQWDKLGEEGVLLSILTVIQMMVLILPALGISAAFWQLGRRITVGAWQRTEGYPVLRGAAVVGLTSLAAFMSYVWWPNGDYRPVQPAEKGTLVGAVEQFKEVPTGRPALTEERLQQLGGAPFEGAPPGVDEGVGVTDDSGVQTTSTQTQTTQTTQTQTTPTQTQTAQVTTNESGATVGVSTPTATATTPVTTATVSTSTTATTTTP